MYKELCLAAKNKEKKLIELKKCQMCRKSPMNREWESASGRSAVHRLKKKCHPAIVMVTGVVISVVR